MEVKSDYVIVEFLVNIFCIQLHSRDDGWGLTGEGDVRHRGVVRRVAKGGTAPSEIWLVIQVDKS